MGPGVLQVEQLRGHWEEAGSRAEHIKAAKEVELRARREGALKQEEDAEARRAEARARSTRRRSCAGRCASAACRCRATR